MKMKTDFKGIIPALYTCFDNSGQVNCTETARLAKWLVQKGVGGFYLCGTTGSGLLLSMEERKKITETISCELDGQVPLMVHVGCMAIRDAIELAKHAAGLKGVKGISSLGPQYYSVPFAEEIQCLSAVAQASELPFYPYLFGSMVEKYGVEKIIDGFSAIPNMAGLKAFVSDLAVHQTIIKQGPGNWQVFHGYDQCLFYAMNIKGIEAAIGSTYNIVPEIVVEIVNAVQKGNFERGRALQEKFSDYWISIQGFSFLAFGAYFLSQRGFKTGPMRLPLRLPTEAEIQTVCQKLKKSGFDITCPLPKSI